MFLSMRNVYGISGFAMLCQYGNYDQYWIIRQRYLKGLHICFLEVVMIILKQVLDRKAKEIGVITDRMTDGRADWQIEWTIALLRRE